MVFEEYSTQIEHIALYEFSDDDDGMFFFIENLPNFCRFGITPFHKI